MKMIVPIVLAMAAAVSTVISRVSLLYTSALLAITLVAPIYGHNDAMSGKSFCDVM